MAYLDVTGLRIEYERGVPTLAHYDLSVDEGELVSLLGPSGCGKTTTLRAIAGFIEPAGGQITVNGKDHTRLPPNKRDIGMVFQSYALFPHLTVFDNVAFGLKMRRIAKSDLHNRVVDALRMVDLYELTDRKPDQLSGGQRQRVALARAIVIEPTLLLFDEPLSNLDAKLRVSMRTEIRRLQQRLGITALYVTHDQVEALAISDRIVVMNNGAIEQIGEPEEIYSKPETAFVADFMGFANKFTATITEKRPDALIVRQKDMQFTVALHGRDIDMGDVSIFFRPDAASLSAVPAENSVPCNIVLRTFHGNVVEYIVTTEMGEFVIHQESDAPRFDTGNAHLILNASKLIPIPT
ncbi:MAG: ABC transporter ATP-binding protein [Chloroflexota bacterium]